MPPPVDENMTPEESVVARHSLFKMAGEQLADPSLSSDSVEYNNRIYASLVEKIGDEGCRKLAIFQLPNDFKLSVVMPVFNEAATIREVIERVLKAPIPCELVIVDDGSSDGTGDALKQFEIDFASQHQREQKSLKLIFHDVNQGKGAALKTGFLNVTGDVVVIQDADMEYDPQDFPSLLQPILADEADIVYGSRFSSQSQHDSPLWHQMGNRMITILSNFSTGQRFTDVETCYKMFRKPFLERIAPTLQEKGFGIELEMTAKLAKIKGIRFAERPIRYDKRGYTEGKKIGWKDGVWAIWCILRY